MLPQAFLFIGAGEPLLATHSKVELFLYRMCLSLTSADYSKKFSKMVIKMYTQTRRI